MPEENERAADERERLRYQLMRRATAEIYVPHRPSVVFPTGNKVELYDLCAEQMRRSIGSYLEFGVYTGWSMRQMVQRFINPDARFVGFDSFEGLPEQWKANNMAAGHFSTGQIVPDIPDRRITYVRGWFQNTVSDFLQDNPPLRSPVLVHFDADLYSSTLFLMTTLWHFVPEYHFFFDEFAADEIVAMYDFVTAYPVEFEFIASVEDEEQKPQQV